MHMVQIHGRRPGLQMISLVSLIRTAAGVGLAEAKQMADSVMDGGQPQFSMPSERDAQRLVVELTKVGALARVVPG